MDIIKEFGQLGIGAGTLLVFYLLMREVVKHFVNTIDNLHAIIGNHMGENTKALTNLEKSITKHDETIEKLIEKL